MRPGALPGVHARAVRRAGVVTAGAREHRRGWALPLIRRGRDVGDVPSYGSPEWCRLPHNDPRRIAAVVIAAECWAVDGDDLEARLRRELADAAAAEERLADEDFAEMAKWVRRMADRPTIAELRQRRGVT